MRKNLLAVLAIVSFAGIATAQSPKMSRSNAGVDLQDFKSDKQGNLSSLDKAKTSIDKALEDKDMAAEPKTWVYKGQIYQEICNNDAFYAMKYPHQWMTACDAFMKVIELDAQKKFKKEVTEGLLGGPGVNGVVAGAFNDGISAHNLQKSEDAYKAINGVIVYMDKLMAYEPKITPESVKADYGLDLSVANYLAALHGAKINKLDEAMALIPKIEDLAVKLKDKDKVEQRVTEIYNAVFNAYLNAGNKEKAKAVITAAKAKFPNSQRMLIASIVMAQSEGKLAEVESDLVKAVENDPKNDNLQLVLGNVYNDLYNQSLDRKNKAIKDGNTDAASKERELAADYFAKSTKYFLGASTINPQNLDALTNLGVIYFNTAVDNTKEANLLMDIDINAKTDKLDAAKKDNFDKALSTFKKGETVSPSNPDILDYIKKFYQITGDEENTKIYTDKLAKVKAGGK